MERWSVGAMECWGMTTIRPNHNVCIVTCRWGATLGGRQSLGAVIAIRFDFVRPARLNRIAVWGLLAIPTTAAGDCRPPGLERSEEVNCSVDNAVIIGPKLAALLTLESLEQSCGDRYTAG
jgi:hypothetical protein